MKTPKAKGETLKSFAQRYRLPTRLLTTLKIALVFAAGFCAVPARAYTLSVQESAGNVVATGTGAIDLTGLTAGGTGSFNSKIYPSLGAVYTGTNGSPLRGYLTTSFTGPANFGTGNVATADSASGDFVGLGQFSIFSQHILAFDLPLLYQSNDPLSSSATWLNNDFNNLQVAPGTYVWAWGEAANQNFTLQITAPSNVPDSGSTLGLFLLALLVLFGVGRVYSPGLA